MHTLNHSDWHVDRVLFLLSWLHSMSPFVNLTFPHFPTMSSLSISVCIPKYWEIALRSADKLEFSVSLVHAILCCCTNLGPVIDIGWRLSGSRVFEWNWDTVPFQSVWLGCDLWHGQIQRVTKKTKKQSILVEYWAVFSSLTTGCKKI